MSALVRSIAAVSLIITMFAAVSLTGSAQVVNPDTYPDFFTQDVNECYFASVSNGEDFGLGASKTSITVQNLSDEAGVIYLLAGDNGFAEGQFAALQPGASKTFSAASLGIAAGTTAPVAVLGYDNASSQAGKFTAEDGIAIGCVAKQAVTGNNLPSTSSADSSVSGYNATSGREVGFFDDLYLPIVQTNCGPGGCWNTILRVANVGPFDNAAVTVRFFPADDGSGSLDTGFQLEGLLSQGDVWSIDLSEYVADGWVGSAHIYTDDSVVAIADRYKAGTDMWITNTASNAVAESDLQLPGGPSNMPYVLFAPDVRLDYNGWNTGISVANTVDAQNTVNIQYFGQNGNAPQAQTQRLAAHGMTYFYNPSSPSEDECEQPAGQVVTCDYVGGAIVLSQAPVAVAVDGVKYFGNDANVGQAFSYSATGNVFQFQAAPLVQKGSPATGMGATSGLTFLNPNAVGTYVTTAWLNPSGFVGSNFGPSVVWIPGYATGFVYTMTQNNLPNGFTGSALVTSDLPIAGTTANVDYAVSGDGTAIWNLYNPCGYYRAIGDCVYTPAPPAPATKTFDVRPAGTEAWICVVGAAEGQDGKPLAPDFDCAPEWVWEKGANDGGQGEADMFGSPEAALAAGVDRVEIAINYDTNEVVVEVDGIETDAWEISNWVKFDDAGNVVPAGINLACGDDQTPFDGYYINTMDYTDTDGAELFKLGDPNNAIIEIELYDPITDTTVTYCGQIENGVYRLQTPEEMQDDLNTVVPPFQVGADGKASIQLPAGCYYFVVSAEGYVTEVSVRECLEAGQTVNNIFDLEAPVVGEGSLTKHFCATDEVDEDGFCEVPITDPINVSIYDAFGNTTWVGTTDDGYITIDPINYGVYRLAYDVVSGVYIGADSSEIIEVAGDEVVYNDLDVAGILDICVWDEENEEWLDGASAWAVNQATGEIVQLDATTSGGHIQGSVAAGNYVVNAYIGDYTSSAGIAVVTEGEGAGTCGEALGDESGPWNATIGLDTANVN